MRYKSVNWMCLYNYSVSHTVWLLLNGIHEREFNTPGRIRQQFGRAVAHFGLKITAKRLDSIES